MKIKILTLSFVLCSLVYIAFDWYIFPYGLSDIGVYNSLPYGITPEYRNDFEGGFQLTDAYGFSMLSKGNSYTYNNDTIVVESIKQYWYNKESIVVQLVDSKTNTFFAKYSEPKKSENSNVHIAFSDTNPIENIDDYTQVQIVENSGIRNLELVRNYLLFLSLILLSLAIIYKIRA